LSARCTRGTHVQCAESPPRPSLPTPHDVPILLPIDMDLPVLPQITASSRSLTRHSSPSPLLKPLAPAITLPPLTLVHPDAPASRKLEVLRADYERLAEFCRQQHDSHREVQSRLAAEIDRRQSVETHCGLAHTELNRLQYQLNAKSGNSTEPQPESFKAGTNLLTVPGSEDARAEARQKREAKANESKGKTAEAAAQRAATIQRRHGMLDRRDHQFPPVLSKYKRADWEDVAFCLGIAHDVNVDALKQSIFERLASSPSAQADTRYIELWPALDKLFKRRSRKTADPSTISSAPLPRASTPPTAGPSGVHRTPHTHLRHAPYVLSPIGSPSPAPLPSMIMPMRHDHVVFENVITPLQFY
jgi:hypothetical protein